MGTKKYLTVAKLLIGQNTPKLLAFLFGIYLLGLIVCFVIIKIFAVSDTYFDFASLMAAMFAPFSILLFAFLNTTGSFRNMVKLGVTRRNFLLGFLLEQLTHIVLVFCAVPLMFLAEDALNRGVYGTFCRADAEYVNLISPTVLGIVLLASVVAALIGFLCGVGVLRFGANALVAEWLGFMGLAFLLGSIGDHFHPNFDQVLMIGSVVGVCLLVAVFVAGKKLIRINLN
jgi:hypothetical protein